jgi:hypothetical protein
MISRKNHDGLGTSVFKSLFAGGKALFMTLAGYEVGAICYTFMAGAVALPFLGVAAGLLGAAVGGVCTAATLKKIIGSPISDPSKENHQQAQPPVAQDQTATA